MYSVMNCTPHPVAVAVTLLDGEVLCTGNFHAPRRELRGGIDVYVFPPSGYRLACDSAIDGGPLGCTVKYSLSEEAEKERTNIFCDFSQSMGVGMLLIASEISVRALNDRMYDPSGGTPIQAMWPVLARDSLRLPMADRWCDALAVPRAEEYAMTPKERAEAFAKGLAAGKEQYKSDGMLVHFDLWADEFRKGTVGPNDAWREGWIENAAHEFYAQKLLMWLNDW